MGGYGSGRPWGSARYYTVEESCVLDTAWLKSRGVLQPGLIAHSTSRWTRRGDVVASIEWRIDTSEASCEHITLSYTVRRGQEEPERVEERFYLEATGPHYGGVRWWFRCPCGRRCAKLYLPPAARYFRCRICYRLAYDCQRETRADRLLRRAHNIRRRLHPDVSMNPPPKPKWMRWATYHRLLDEAEARQSLSLASAFVRLFPTHPLSAQLRSLTG